MNGNVPVIMYRSEKLYDTEPRRKAGGAACLIVGVAYFLSR